MRGHVKCVLLLVEAGASSSLRYKTHADMMAAYPVVGTDAVERNGGRTALELAEEESPPWWLPEWSSGWRPPPAHRAGRAEVAALLRQYH